jgi:repressor LexA
LFYILCFTVLGILHMLTKKQHQLLTFVHEHLNQHGVSPSFDEMKEALDLKSKSGIHRLITALEERGFIRRLAHRARAIEILRLPEDVEKRSHGNGRFVPSVIEGRFAGGAVPRTVSSDPQDSRETLQIPLFGRIAAGTPIEALRDYSRYVDVHSAILGRGEHYALEVDGDSMIEAGILDGDTVIIEQTDSAENGSIVVALVDDEEATLKRLRRKSGAIALEPANKNYETRIFPPERIKIQGRLVGLIRRY